MIDDDSCVRLEPIYEIMGYRNPRIRRTIQQRPLVLLGESLLTGCLPKRISWLVAEWPNPAVCLSPENPCWELVFNALPSGNPVALTAFDPVCS